MEDIIKDFRDVTPEVAGRLLHFCNANEMTEFNALVDCLINDSILNNFDTELKQDDFVALGALNQAKGIIGRSINEIKNKLEAIVNPDKKEQVEVEDER